MSNNIDSMQNEERLIRIAATVGARTALEAIESERKKEQKSRYSRRLRNTKLLLRNYRELQAHVDNAVFSGSQLEEEENAIDILDLMLERTGRDELYVESIKKSIKRTTIVMRHINDMLDMYDIYCGKSKKPEDVRRSRVVRMMYIDPDLRTVKEIADAEGIDERTVYKDVDAAVEKLSALIFGIDGLKKL